MQGHTIPSMSIGACTSVKDRIRMDKNLLMTLDRISPEALIGIDEDSEKMLRGCRWRQMMCLRRGAPGDRSPRLLICGKSL
jgi:hypothetical protein